MQEEPMNELSDTLDHDLPDDAQPQVTLSRRKRGVGPVVGMPCEPRYKQVGEDCVLANVMFD